MGLKKYVTLCVNKTLEFSSDSAYCRTNCTGSKYSLVIVMVHIFSVQATNTYKKDYATMSSVTGNDDKMSNEL